MDYWNALKVVNQTAGELGLPKLVSLTASENETESVQLLSVLNAAGNDLVVYYPWEQLRRELEFDLVAGQGEYLLPSDWKYFVDQTQWDRTNHWPLLGPKSAAEWAWLKGGLLASFPRIRYRVYNNKFQVWPVPESNSQFKLAMEYVSGFWVVGAGTPDPNADMVIADGDMIMFDPWLMIRYTKLKWLQLKGFDTSAATADFQRMYDALRGKDVGAQVLSLVPQRTPFFIGPWSIPDGNWNV
jgi:hypothetical protein